MRTPFNKTGVHVFPYLIDMAPGNVEPVPINPQLTIDGAPTATLIDYDTEEAVETQPTAGLSGDIAVVTVTAPETPGMYALDITFTGAGESVGRIWSIRLAVRVSIK